MMVPFYFKYHRYLLKTKSFKTLLRLSMTKRKIRESFCCNDHECTLPLLLHRNQLPVPL